MPNTKDQTGSLVLFLKFMPGQNCHDKMDRVKRIWCLSHMRAAKVQASLRIRAVSPEPSLLAHTSSESRGTFRQEARSLASLSGWACAVKICHDGMLEDTNSLGGAQMHFSFNIPTKCNLMPWTRHYLVVCGRPFYLRCWIEIATVIADVHSNGGIMSPVVMYKI